MNKQMKKQLNSKMITLSKRLRIDSEMKELSAGYVLGATALGN